LQTHIVAKRTNATFPMAWKQDNPSGWTPSTEAWVHKWRRALNTPQLTWQQATRLLHQCPLVPTPEQCVPTRLLRRSADQVPRDVVHGAPWIVAGSHPRCQLPVGRPDGAALQFLLFSTEDAQRRTTVWLLDLGGPLLTGVSSDGSVRGTAWFSACRTTLTVDTLLVLHVGGELTCVTPLRFRFPRDGRALDHGEWGSQPAVCAVARRLGVQVDACGSGYAHVCPSFVDKLLGWQSPPALRLFRGKTLFFNPPWLRDVLLAVVAFVLDQHDAGAVVVAPDWTSAEFWRRLDAASRATVDTTWPRGTRGLFAPELHDYDAVVLKGLTNPVSAWWVRPRGKR